MKNQFPNIADLVFFSFFFGNKPVLFLALLSLVFVGCDSPQVPEKEEVTKPLAYELPFQPNILWLVAEDLSPVLPDFGDPTIETPNLGRLAREGVCFDNVFSPSPVCSPSRAALATGMYPTHIAANHMRTGPWFMTDVDQALIDRMAQFFPEGIAPYEALPPAGVRMFSEFLREAGYYCTNNSKQDYQFRCTLTAWDETSNKAHWKNRKPGQRFFSIFNYNVTHESQIWQRAKDSLWVEEDLAVKVPPYLPDTEVGRKDVRRMYSNIKMMDHQVGEMLKELEAAGQLDSTIIVWYSDHGGPLPRQKRLMYDSGLKVPMIIRFPNKLFAGQRDDRLISFIDFGPTALSVAGIQPPDFLDGKAFLGKYQRSEEPQYIFAAADRFDESYDTNRGARDKRFKYIKYFEPDKPMFLPINYRDQMDIMQELYRLRDAGQLTPEQALWFRETKPEEEFFDTKNDPYELNNLINAPEYADKIAELRKACKDWYTSFEDTGLMPEKELVEKLRPNGIEYQVATPKINIVNNRVELSCGTEAATIGYQIINQEQQPAEWTIYTKPFTVKEGDRLRVVGERIGYRYSPIAEKEIGAIL